jgi:signal peptidase I
MGSDGETRVAVDDPGPPNGRAIPGQPAMPPQLTDANGNDHAVVGRAAVDAPVKSASPQASASPGDDASPRVGVQPQAGADPQGSADPLAGAERLSTDAVASAGLPAAERQNADARGDDGLTPDLSADSDEADERARRRSWLTELVLLVVLALVLTVVVKAYLVQPFRIPSQSMENTLQVNDKVLVDKLVGHMSQIQRGDIIVFNGTGSWNPPARGHGGNVFSRVVNDVGGLFVSGAGQTYYIKRVIGLPGDRVSCCNARGLITVNGVALHESTYLYPGSQPSAVRFNIVVPPGRLWVMGDNRADSQDSRFFMCGVPDAQCNPWDRDGTIPENMVVGRAFMIVWPPSRVRMLSVPRTFDQPGLNTPRHRKAKSRPHESRKADGRAAAGRVSVGPAETAGGASVSADPAASSSNRLLGLAAAQGIRVVPASPLPLWLAGIGAAIPLTLIERKVRLRRGHGRKRSRRSRADLTA